MIGICLQVSQEVRQEMRLELTLRQRVLIQISEAIITPQGDCPRCNCKLTEKQIKAGWNCDPYDARTTCPKCGARFVASLLVSKIGGRKRKQFRYLCQLQLFTALSDVLRTTGRRLLGRTFLFQKQPELLFNLVRHFGAYELGLAAYRESKI